MGRVFEKLVAGKEKVGKLSRGNITERWLLRKSEERSN